LSIWTFVHHIPADIGIAVRRFERVNADELPDARRVVAMAQVDESVVVGRFACVAVGGLRRAAELARLAVGRVQAAVLRRQVNSRLSPRNGLAFFWI
jgi:hypothetical protein